MTWFAFKGYDDVSVAGVQEKQLVAAGFHGYSTQQEADQNANDVAFWQKPLLNLIEADYRKAVQEGATPGGPNNIETLPGIAAAGLAGTTGGFFGAIIGFLAALADVTMWRSLAWILLGAVLIIAGIVLWLRDAGVIPQTTPVPVPVPL